MTTLFKQILPIPEQVIVGSGSYTIPANKYAFFQGTVSGYLCSVPFVANAAGLSPLTNPYYQATESASVRVLASAPFIETTQQDHGHQWLVAGDTITVVISTINIRETNLGSINAWGSYARYSYIAVNGSAVVRVHHNCARYSRAGGVSNTFASAYSSAVASWSCSLFAIPKNNLPIELTEGN